MEFGRPSHQPKYKPLPEGPEGDDEMTRRARIGAYRLQKFLRAGGPLPPDLDSFNEPRLLEDLGIGPDINCDLPAWRQEIIEQWGFDPEVDEPDYLTDS